MRALLRGNAPFVRTVAAQCSLEQLKAQLSSCEVLHLFDAPLPVYVATELSPQFSVPKKVFGKRGPASYLSDDGLCVEHIQVSRSSLRSCQQNEIRYICCYELDTYFKSVF